MKKIIKGIKNIFNKCEHPQKELIFIKNIYADADKPFDKDKSMWYCNKCESVIYKNFIFDKGNLSDGYHTFNELYFHRMILTMIICHNYKELCWKSKKHHDDTMYDGMFIVGINTPEGQATYHYDDIYWNLFDITELEKAPEWDGHTSQDAIIRIESLKNYIKPEEKIIQYKNYKVISNIKTNFDDSIAFMFYMIKKYFS